MEKLFINNQFEIAEISSIYWEQFLEELSELKDGNLIIGKCSMGSDVNWHFANLECYAMRVYSRALTDEEVIESYNASVSYHAFLEEQN